MKKESHASYLNKQQKLLHDLMRTSGQEKRGDQRNARARYLFILGSRLGWGWRGRLARAQDDDA
ncbi:MAG: hypothetical protein WA110_09200 [Anaerolineaceae bacterium]